MALLASEHRTKLDGATYVFRVFTEQERCDVLDMPLETPGQITKAMYAQVATVLLRIENLKDADGSVKSYDFAGPDKGKVGDVLNLHRWGDVAELKKFVENEVMGLSPSKAGNSDGQRGPLPDAA